MGTMIQATLNSLLNILVAKRYMIIILYSVVSLTCNRIKFVYTMQFYKDVYGSFYICHYVNQW